jgi:hypothetical protein
MYSKPVSDRSSDILYTPNQPANHKPQVYATPHVVTRRQLNAEPRERAVVPDVLPTVLWQGCVRNDNLFPTYIPLTRAIWTLVKSSAIYMD